MIISTLWIILAPENRKEALAVLRCLMERTQVEPGCIRCRLYQDVANPEEIIFEEIWKCQMDLERHIRTERYRNLLAVMEMSNRKPEIRFNWVSHTAGLETIKALREEQPEC